MEALSIVVAMRNRYVCHAHISEVKFRQLLRAFAADLTAWLTLVMPNISVSIMAMMNS